ncbi:MAG: DNA gyrase inhibitor YacG [Tabrizicola sp.]|nr:DNA gyrase inhibitor YacG [Tabrizicola sp.]
MSCPVCGKPTDAAYRPFCSRRCADVDLGRWLTESYRIPAESPDEGEDVPQDAPSPKPH